MTLHPDVSGRPQVPLMLERLLDDRTRREGVRFLTYEQAVDDFRRRYPFSGQARAFAC
jgi:peptidoglycan-N-acetylglucosamine deacetylase